jgi:shikimate kinase
MSPSSPKPVHVVLLGMMASGKTTLGRALSARLRRPYLDNDERFLSRFGQTPAQVAAGQGAEALHRMEAQVLEESLSRSPPAIIAAHGGAVLDARLRTQLLPTLRVWLEARPETLALRISEAGHRPFLTGDFTEALTKLDAERRPHYAALAEVVLDVDTPRFDLEAAVGRVVGALEERER